jgi:PAS domain S-box-containing protein
VSEALVIADLKRRIEELRRELATAVQLARRVMTESSADSALVRIARAQREARDEVLRAVLAGSFDAMLVTEDHGRVIDANAAAAELFGRSVSELTRCKIADLTPPGYEPPAAWERFVGEGLMRGQVSLACADGTLRVAAFSAVANIAPGRHLTVLRDASADLQ